MMKISITTEVGARFWRPEETLAKLAQAGFTGADCSLQVYPVGSAFWEEGGWEQQADALRDAAKREGIAIVQTHAPFPSSADDPIQDERIFKTIEKAVCAAGRMGSRYIVVHPLIPMTLDYTAHREEIFKINRTFFAHLAPVAQKAGVQIAIENMFRYDRAAEAFAPTFCSGAQDLLELLDALDGPFAACLDTGHANVNGTKPGDMARALGERLQVLHIHDNGGFEDDHTAPFLGTIDWEDFCAALREIGYAGAISLETLRFEAALPEDAYPQGLVLLRALAGHLAARCG